MERVNPTNYLKLLNNVDSLFGQIKRIRKKTCEFKKKYYGLENGC